jgi:hypothetical protein
MKNSIKYILPGIFLLNLAFAQNNDVLEIPSIRIGQVKYAGFKLESGRNIHIKAIGAGADRMPSEIKNFQNDPSGMFVYAWIINAQTRDLVWQMNVDNTEDVSRRGYNREFDDDIRLPAGEYEVYFTAQEPYNINFDDGFFSLGRLLDRILRGSDKHYDDEDNDWELTIQNVYELSSPEIIDKFHTARKKQSALTITNVKNADFQQQGFTLTQKGKFNIYAIGEAYEGSEYDYGWIVRADNSKKVWEMVYENSEHAGGAIKNRVWKAEIELDPGDYWIYYVTDDSHSPDYWNANPPYDPDFYGITINGVPGEFNPKSIKELIKMKVNPIIEMTKVGNDAIVKKGFKNEEDLKVRIHALGEGRDGRMFDYGWIENVNTHRKVWNMDYSRTRHGGGASKNRVIDEIIELPAGSYMVYYITDDSHAYPEWNSSSPYDPTSWGIIIYPADAKYSEKRIKKFSDIEKSSHLIVQAIRVRDDERIRRRFTLEKETELRIYAIGEGEWEEMYDYGWIEDLDEDETVWEMTYEKTRWAGGAKKNRKVDTIITLKPGHYELNYVTDHSHSFNNWNDNAPDDPINWGITIYDASKK